MSLQLIYKRFVESDVRQQSVPITSPAQIVRAVLVGLLLAFLVFWVLPQSRVLLANQNDSTGVVGFHHLG